MSALDLDLLASIAKQMFAGDELGIRSKRVRVGRTGRHGLRTVVFRMSDREDETIEQNAGKPSRWGQLARTDHKGGAVHKQEDESVRGGRG